MLPEQQQRIMGYFIEEAKDHLNTIEQGLLNLQSTIADSEMMNEIFRAAHSVKGGAAMLGISSIQKTAHRLEDYFKVLKEEQRPIPVDQKLESLFLRVFDTLHELLEQLQGPFGLSEDVANGIMASAEPVFDQLHTHLEALVGGSGGAALPTPEPVAPAPQPAVVQATNTPSQVFQADVPLKLRDLLQLFKQPETAETRQQLQGVCGDLKLLGDRFSLSGWCDLVETARQVIGNPDNPYRTLAPLVIKELKQAQDLILANRSAEIACSAKLKELLPVAVVTGESLDLDFLGGMDVAVDDTQQDFSADLADFVTAAEQTAPTSTGSTFDLSNFMATGANDLSQDFSADLAGVLDEQPGPEVGMAELNSLADLFEGEALDLGSTWQEEEILGEAMSAPAVNNTLSSTETPGDFSDLLGEMSMGQETPTNEVDDLANLFGDDFLGEETQSTQTSSPISQSGSADPLDDLLDIGSSSMDNEHAPMGTRLERDPAALDNLGDLFGSLDETDLLGESGVSDDELIDSLDLNPSETAGTVGLPTDSGDLGLPEELANSDVTGAAGNFDLDDLFDGADAAGNEAVTSSNNLDDLLFDNLSGLGPEVNLPEVTESVTGGEALSDFDGLFDGGEAPTTDVVDTVLDELDLFEAPEAVTTSATTAADLDDLFDSAPAEDISPEQFQEPVESEQSIEAWLNGEEAETPDTEIPSEPFDDLFGEELQVTDNTGLGLDTSLDELASLDFVGPEGAADLAPDVATGFDDSLVQIGDDLAVQIEADSLPGMVSSEVTEDADVLGLFGEAETAGSDEQLDLDQIAASPTELGLEDLETSGFMDETTDLDSLGLDSLDQSTASTLDDISFDEFEQGALVDLDVAAPEASSSAGTSANFEGLDAFDLDSLVEINAEGPDEGVGANDLAVGFDDLDTLLDSSTSPTDGLGGLDTPSSIAVDDSLADLGLDDLIEGLPAGDVAAVSAGPENMPVEATSTVDEFADLEALLDVDTSIVSSEPATAAEAVVDEFADLEALLGEPSTSVEAPPSSPPTPVSIASPPSIDSEFDDLEKLLEDADKTMGGPPTVKPTRGVAQQQRRTRPPVVDQNMRVPVKQLDNLSNLVGELVVNRNSLEQDQERLRQFLDNLLYQVQQLSDVGQRMRDLYERSLLESSLLASRQSYYTSGNASQTSHSTGASFDALEMDRFTGFHSLSQEMIELIVRVRESASDIEFIIDETDQVTRNFRQVTTQLQEGLNRARMMPFSNTADRLPRGVRDNALEYGKQAELVVEGRETLIDKMILEKLVDPLTHLVNNAVAHGIERPDVRQAAGKPPTGKITVRAFYQGNQTVISVSDDGAGIDPERIKAKALEKGLISPAEAKTMSRLDVYEILFLPGFSGADQVTKIAGRGVGMDVVRTNLTEIRGTVSIDSTIGKGTTFTIRLPLTLSISKALCCISNRARIAFPMDGVEDMLDVPKERIQTNSDGQPCILWRDMMLPFRSLSEVLKYSRYLGRGSVYGGNQEDDIVSIVVLRSAGNFIALQVDQVLGEQEIVIKQLEGPVPKPVGVAGATVLGDGRIMPIADVLELIDLVQGRIRREASAKLWNPEEQPPEPPTVASEPTVLIVDDSITVRELLSMTFNKVGYRVEQARDGQEAWEKLRSGLPCDMVFCDIEMPRMDGLELLSRIQKDPVLNQLPIAMLTSRGADRHRQMAIQLGARGYFTKPYLEEALLDAAQRMLKGEVLVTAG